MIGSRFSLRDIWDWLVGRDTDHQELLRMLRRRAELDHEIRRRTGFAPPVAAYVEYADGRGPNVFYLHRTVPIDALIATSRLSHNRPDLLEAIVDDPEIIGMALSLQNLYQTIDDDQQPT